MLKLRLYAVDGLTFITTNRSTALRKTTMHADAADNSLKVGLSQLAGMN